MAWDAAFAALATGQDLVDELALGIKAALQERTGWVNAGHALADGLPVTGWWTRDFFYNAQGAVEACMGAFKDTESPKPTGGWNGWSKNDLLGHLYDSHGGEASGVGYFGGGYDWIRRPSRDGALIVGRAQVGDTIYWENFKALQLAIQHLRWLQVEEVNPRVYDYMGKDGPNYKPTPEQAWSQMLADPPRCDGMDSWVGIYYRDVAGAYYYTSQRNYFRAGLIVTPAAGHNPSGYDANRIHFRMTSAGARYKGPYAFHGGAYWNTGKCQWSEAEYDQGTLMNDSVALSAYDAYEVFSADEGGALPTAPGDWYFRVSDAVDEEAAGPGATHYGRWPAGDKFFLLGRVVTDYGD